MNNTIDPWIIDFISIVMMKKFLSLGTLSWKRVDEAVAELMMSNLFSFEEYLSIYGIYFRVIVFIF